MPSKYPYTVVIDEYKPPLDIAIPAMEHFHRGINIETSIQPEFIGLALDVRKIIRRFNEDFTCEIYLQETGKQIMNNAPKNVSEDRPIVSIGLDASESYDMTLDERYLKTRSYLISKSNESYKHNRIKVIGLSSGQLDTCDKTPTENVLEQHFGYIPRAYQEVDMIFGFIGTDYRVTLRYFPPIQLEELDLYAITNNENQLLDTTTWHNFADPIYNKAKGSWIATVLDCLARNQTIEEFVNQFDVSTRKSLIEENLKDSVPNALRVVDHVADSEEDIDVLLDEFDIPVLYKGLFLRPILGSLNANNNNGRLGNIVNEYNRVYPYAELSQDRLVQGLMDMNAYGKKYEDDIVEEVTA